jgi:hypothetical protein
MSGAGVDWTDLRLGRQFRRVIAVAPVEQRLKYIFALQFIPKGV